MADLFLPVLEAVGRWQPEDLLEVKQRHRRVLERSAVELAIDLEVMSLAAARLRSINGG